MQLLCEAAPGLSERAADLHAIGLNVRRSYQPASRTWLTSAALSDTAADTYDQELAALIHDLKNEVVAAQIAAIRPAANRTERLQRDLTSSRHLDTAGGLASRLRDADMLYSAANLVGSTDLAPFMQAYVSDLIRRTPRIRIIPPTFAPAVVAIDERALRVVLDNLVKNAEEAMADGGQLTFDYTASPGDEAVLLEVADSGEGIPSDVIEAFQAGRPTTSSKRGGSGLRSPVVVLRYVFDPGCCAVSR